MNTSNSLAMIDVDVSDTQDHLRVDRRSIIDLVRRTLALEGVRSASISLVLVDDATIHRLNRLHLQHDWPTDVITFPLSTSDDEELSGEVVVSAETAACVAAEPMAELALYIVHGLLHLRGYDDQDPESIVAMRRREGEVLSALQQVGHFSIADGRGGEPCRR